MQVGGWATQRTGQCGDQRWARGGLSTFDRGQRRGSGVGGISERGMVKAVEVSVSAEPSWGENRLRSGGRGGWDWRNGVQVVLWLRWHGGDVVSVG